MRFAILFSALLVFSACDRAGLTTENSGFTATVSGDLTQTYTGEATFIVTTPVEGAGPVVQILLDPDGDLNQSITITDANRQIQGRGTYPVGNVNQAGVFVPIRLLDVTLDSEDPTFAAVSGTLEITRDDGAGLDGTFRAQIANSSATGGQQATLDGSFRARRADDL